MIEMEDDYLKLAERLILPADFKPNSGGVEDVRRRVLALAESVEGTGVVIKVNSALRACGYGLIKDLHDRGVEVMADLKLVDITETMETDALIVAEFSPELLTVMCCAGIDGMRRVQESLAPAGTEVLGVTVLTSLNEEECQAIFTCSTKAGVLRFARMAQLAGLGGLVLSGAELEVVSKRQELMMSFNTPAIRPVWSTVDMDDQAKSRVVTPKKAIETGADRIVVGRPILGAKPNDKGLPQNPREAVERTIAEIIEGLAERKR
jgi:orotidine-5'-phosphate decarboxylase